MILLIANNANEAYTLHQYARKEVDVVGLSLWPDAQFKFEDLNIPSITTNEVMGIEEHEFLASVVTTLARSWWTWLFPNIKEPTIDGLSITTIYEYEVEQSFSRILFNVYSVIKAIEKLSPAKCLFVSSGMEYWESFSSDNMIGSMSLLTWLGKYPWEMIFADHINLNESVKFLPSFEYLKPLREKKNDFIKKSFVNKLKPKLIRLLFEGMPDIMSFKKKVFTQRNDDQLNDKRRVEYIISGGTRCLGALLNILSEKHDIGFLQHAIFGINDKEYNGNEKNDSILKNTDNLNDSAFYDCKLDVFEIAGFSYFQIVKDMAKFVLKQFSNLEMHYKFLHKKIIDTNPHAFITISGAGAIDRINIWSFYKSGVRTIWVADGLGQPNKKIAEVVNSGFWFDSPAEKWLVSENMKNFLSTNTEGNKKLQVTGYLNKNFQGKPINKSYFRKWMLEKILGISNKNKIVLYASSTSSKSAMRLISEETSFEILQAIKDIGEAFVHDSNVVTLIKLHPGESDFTLVCKTVDHVSNIKIIQSIPIHLLIDIADVVIVYHSSVGLEALYRAKHLIIYNTTNRPSYYTECISGLNQDHSKAAAVRSVNCKKDLYSTAMSLINSNKRRAASRYDEELISPDLSYYLANADYEFDGVQTAYKLLLDKRI